MEIKKELLSVEENSRPVNRERVQTMREGTTRIRPEHSNGFFFVITRRADTD